MRNVNVSEITNAVANLTKACGKLEPCAKRALETALKSESNKNAAFALKVLLDNAEIAERENLPVCQDTGMAVFFITLGQDVHIEGGLLNDAVNEGVRRGYAENSYRASVLDPVSRINTGDNTPAVIHVELTAGDKIEIKFLPRGFGSENMSKLYMLKPSDGMDGVKDAIVDAVRSAGANPCPPIVVGVGIGGTAEKAVELAKAQLLREIGSVNGDEYLASFENDVLKRINALGIGAQGFGGKTSALAVHAAKYPTHISALPVAVCIQCNCVRQGGVII